MPNTIPYQDWLQVIIDEYLSTFVKEGGGSIKFTVTPDDVKPGLRHAVKKRCEELNYLFVSLDAAKARTIRRTSSAGSRPVVPETAKPDPTRIRAHMPQDFFFGLAGQVDWRSMARRFLLQRAGEKDFQVEGIDPCSSDNVFAAIAEANGIERKFVLTELRPEIEREIAKNVTLARDFRVAISQLCWLENTYTAGKYDGQPILDWLTGANTRISPVRPFSIFTPINRTTARYFIESTLQWIRLVGYSGTVIFLDNSRVTLAWDPKDGLWHYTRAMAVDHYELLRELIDDVERLAGTMLVVATNSGFVEESSSRRSKGYGIYPALRTRIMNDVRDRNLVNPVASLVRLS